MIEMLSETESGLVTSIADDKAMVQLTRTESCERCGAKFICRPGDDGFREMRAYNPLQANVGDYVEITETGNLLLKLSLIQFGIPLLGLVLGIFVVFYLQPANTLLSKEVNMSIGGLIGLLAGGGIVWGTLKTWAKKISCVFEIVRVTNESKPTDT